MRPDQYVEIRELAHNWLTKEQLDGMVDYLFGIPYLSEINDQQADEAIKLLQQKRSPTAIRRAAKAAEVMS